MAITIPSACLDFDPRSKEDQMFQALKKLPDNYYVLYSVHLYDTVHAYYDEDGRQVSSPSYNKYGDYIVYRPNASDDAPIYDLPVNYTAGAFSKALYIDPLNAVYDNFTADGIRVLFTYAPRNKSALSEESDAAALAELDAWFRETLHAEVISPIEDSLYPGRYLFGTDNHLSTDGVAIRSERIRRDLEEVLDDAK